MTNIFVFLLPLNLLCPAYIINLVNDRKLIREISNIYLLKRLG